MNQYQGWIASLSNGETVFETEEPGAEYSPWQTLLRRLKKDELKITQLRLQRGGNTVMASRDMGAALPDGFVQAYEQRKALFSGKKAHYQGVGAVVGDQVFMNWVDASGNSWQEVRPLSELRVHSTMDWQVDK